jgi:hypothetical protein
MQWHITNALSTQVIYKVSINHARLDIPKDDNVCPPAIASILRQCWQDNPDSRPSASEVQEQLEEFLSWSL